MKLEKLEEIIANNNFPKYRINQIKKAVFKDSQDSFLNISNLPLNLREILNQELEILQFKIVKVSVSKDKKTFKALLSLKDNFLVETVLISPKNGFWSACISSQVGCVLGCRFCATGKMGFKRNLTIDEITSQVLFWRQYLKKNRIEGDFSNIVFMGMGEPFLNWENVKQSIKDLTDSDIFAFRNRAVSVSTAGILTYLNDFAEEFPQANLAVSLHFVDDKKRDDFMKVNQKFNLNSLKKALQSYLSQTKRKVFLEYILLENINDKDDDIYNLARFIKEVGYSNLLHVNLIRYNSVIEDLLPSSKNRTYRFKELLEKRGISVTIRKSLGEDILGACGQLAGKGSV